MKVLVFDCRKVLEINCRKMYVFTCFLQLSENSNLWMDISWVVFDYYIKDEFPNNFVDGDSLNDWVNLIEKYPDRLMIGSDKVGHWETYPQEILKYNLLIDRLQPETAAKLCKYNILSLVKHY